MTESPKDGLDEIKALSAKSMARETELRHILREVERGLNEAVGASKLKCMGVEQKLMGANARIIFRGRLHFTHGLLRVAYRSRDDVAGQYHLTNIDDCDANWLASLAMPESVGSLMSNVADSLRRSEERYAAATRKVREKMREASLSLSTAAEEAATRLGYQQVLVDWRKAQVAGVDPATALTQARTMLESVFKHLVEEWHISMPANAGNDARYQAVRVAILERFEPHLHKGLTRILGGIQTIVQGVGDFRNNASDAHGRGPSENKPSDSVARLAVNSAGVAATFLMELVERSTPPDGERK